MRFRFVQLPKTMQMNVVNSCLILRFLKSRALLFLVVLLLAISLCDQTEAQASSKPTKETQTSGRPPLARLYWHFLDFQRFLDKSADEQEKKGKNGAELREKLQRKLGFSNYQFTLIRDAAQKLDRDLKKKDAQAMAVIEAFRKKYPPDQPLKAPLPPPPPELETLQQERDNLIEQHVADLKMQLGPEAARKLDSFLLNEFAPAVTTHSVSAPASQQGAGQASQAVRRP